MASVKNCFNYVGSKDRILPFIERNLPDGKKYFIDMFCGSGVVGVNVVDDYEKVILNDACWQVTETLNYFKNNSYEDIMSGIEHIIEKFELSKTNKEGYDRLRDFYSNATNLKENFNPLVFYCLLTHSFNYNIHINSSGGFSVPFGKNRSSFNNSLRDKFKKFQKKLHGNKDKIYINSLNFTDFILNLNFSVGDCIFYCDPPYLTSDSAYGRVHYLGKWDATKERALYETLDYIASKGGCFLLSNVMENNGMKNDVLAEWASKYTVIDVPTDYSGCNYQRKNLGGTREVLVRNY